jgi:hypothetical protein
LGMPGPPRPWTGAHSRRRLRLAKEVLWLALRKPLHNDGMHILLIEDDLDLGRALQAALKVEGLKSEWLRRAADAPRTVDGTVVVLLAQMAPQALAPGHGPFAASAG